MKSPMVEKARWINRQEKDGYSDLKILHSNAGYYVGTIYKEMLPGTRDSEYFKTEAEAKVFLATVESLTFEEAAKLLRKEP